MWTAMFYQTPSDDLQSSAAARFRCSHESGWLRWHQSLVWSLINFLLESRGQARPWGSARRNGFGGLDEVGGFEWRQRANQPAEDYDTLPWALNLGRCMRRDWWRHLVLAGRQPFPAQARGERTENRAHAGTKVPPSGGGTWCMCECLLCSERIVKQLQPLSPLTCWWPVSLN